MWTYIIRRLLIMIPTLFGVTIVSFCIMQMAPGDPLLNQLGVEGAQGESTQTRQAYLIQKRDLKLDKPLLINICGFRDYREELRLAAHYRASTEQEIVAELSRLASHRGDAELRHRLDFLRSLDIDKFGARLEDPDKHRRLAQAVQGYVQVFCEDLGGYGVPDAIHLLNEEQLDLRMKIGVIECLNFMVVEAHKHTYSRNPSPKETPLVTAVWETWWQRHREEFPEVPQERRAVLEEQLAEMSEEPSRGRLFQLLEQEYYYDRNDLPFFAEALLGDSSLREKVVSSIILNLYVARPLRMTASRDAQPQQVERVIENWMVHYEPRRSQYEPGWLIRARNIVTDTQYAHMVWRLITFDFGRSALKTNEPVSEKLWRAVLVSAPLMLMAQLVIYLVAIPLGVVCSISRGQMLDRIISLKLFFLYSVPPFVAGMLFLLFFCYGNYLKWFPMGRLHSDGAEQFGWALYLLDYLWHATLPVICLSLFSLAGLAMYARTSMLDVIGQDFIRTARSKGLSRPRVVLKHALRNALIPVLTLFSNFLPAMLGGSVLIEYLFNIPGMGRLSWESIEQKDFPTLMALIYVQAIVVMLSILLTDLLYVFVDPRISFSSQETAR